LNAIWRWPYVQNCSQLRYFSRGTGTVCFQTVRREGSPERNAQQPGCARVPKFQLVRRETHPMRFRVSIIGRHCSNRRSDNTYQANRHGAMAAASRLSAHARPGSSPNRGDGRGLSRRRGDDAREVRKVRFKLADKRAALVDIGKCLGLSRPWPPIGMTAFVEAMSRLRGTFVDWTSITFWRFANFPTNRQSQAKPMVGADDLRFPPPPPDHLDLATFFLLF
jgi:hypothetical protein